jgi:hypothetical protein
MDITLKEHMTKMRKLRMLKTTPEQRKASAKKAVEARIKKYNQKRRLTSTRDDDTIKECSNR